MKILLHDYAGHAFTVQLSRTLAARGHNVRHVYSSSLTTTPQGSLARTESDPETFHSFPVDLGRKIDKQNYKQVFLKDDPEHARIVTDHIREFKPDVVLSGNTSPRINHILLDACRTHQAAFVCWVQDLFGPSASTILPEKYGLVGQVAARFVQRSEQRMIARSQGVVVITEEFKPHLGQPKSEVTVIENWAPLDEIPARPRLNPWGEAQGLAQTRNFIYSGTIGMKHNPELLVQIAAHYRATPDVRVVVISAGKGMDYLQSRKQELQLDGLVLLPFQPFEALPDVLATADVLVAVLEPEAGVFSVPSKVLSYLCSGRAIMLGVPPENLAARIVLENHAGRVVAPQLEAEFVAAAAALMDDRDACAAMGAHARAYAESTFDIQRIAERFENVFQKAMKTAR